MFSDYVSTLVVKRSARHRALIDKYEIQFFTPEQSLEDFRDLASKPASYRRLAFEMGVYLTYMRDGRIARRWAELIEAHPELLHRAEIEELTARIEARNSTQQDRLARGGTVHGGQAH